VKTKVCKHGRAKVIDSYRLNNFYYRRKQCPTCDTRFTTVEMSKDYFDWLHATPGTQRPTNPALLALMRAWVAEMQNAIKTFDALNKGEAHAD